MMRLEQIHPCKDCAREIDTPSPVCIACRQKRIKAKSCIVCGKPCLECYPSGKRKAVHPDCLDQQDAAFAAAEIPNRTEPAPAAYRDKDAKEDTYATKHD